MHSVMVSGAVESENCRFFAPNVSLALTHTCTYTRACSRSNAIDLKSAPAVIGRCKRWMVCVNRSACVEDHWFPRATESLGLQAPRGRAVRGAARFLGPDPLHQTSDIVEPRGGGERGGRGVVPEVGCSWKTERVVL